MSWREPGRGAARQGGGRSRARRRAGLCDAMLHSVSQLESVDGYGIGFRVYTNYVRPLDFIPYPTVQSWTALYSVLRAGWRARDRCDGPGSIHVPGGRADKKARGRWVRKTETQKRQQATRVVSVRARQCAKDDYSVQKNETPCKEHNAALDIGRRQPSPTRTLGTPTWYTDTCLMVRRLLPTSLALAALRRQSCR